MMKRSHFLQLLQLTILAGLLVSSGTALAQLTEAQKDALKSNCRSDYMSNCFGVTPGGKEALMCLNNHHAKLSPSCQAAVTSAMPKPAAAAPPPPAQVPPPAAAAVAPAPPPPAAVAVPPPAAAPPAKAAAPAAVIHPKPRAAAAPRPAPPPLQPAAIAPPPPKAPAITGALIAKIEALPLPRRMALARACDKDKEANCNRVKPGGAGLILCLIEHEPALSPYCKGVLTATLK